MSARDTRQRILIAAQRLIESGGYARLTTKDIAREAGCAEGTLFNHFGRKEDLCLAVVLENAPKFRQAIAGVDPGAKTVSQNLQDIAVSAMTFFDKLIPLSVSLFGDTDLLLRHRQSMSEHGRGPADVFELVSNYVAEEQRLGRIASKVSPTSATALLLGPCFQRAFIRQVMGRDLIPVPDIVVANEIVSTLLAGLAPMTEDRSTDR